MGRLQDIKNKEQEWADEYNNYTKEAHEIDNLIKTVSDTISREVGAVNTLKEVLEPQMRTIYYFLNGIGNVSSLPNYSTLKKDTFTGYTPKAYLPTANKREYMYEEEVGKLKEVGRAAKDYMFYGAGGRYSRPKLKSALSVAVQNYNKEKIDWEHDKGERSDKLKEYKLKLEIAELYHKVFSVVISTMENIIIPEIPGIKAFLYAQGVKDAVISGELPSESKPAPIKRFLKSTAYTRHVNFVKNTNDFYLMFVKYYENDYLTELIESKDKNKVSKDKDNLLSKVDLLKDNVVFGGRNE